MNPSAHAAARYPPAELPATTMAPASKPSTSADAGAARRAPIDTRATIQEGAPPARACNPRPRTRTRPRARRRDKCGLLLRELLPVAAVDVDEQPRPRPCRRRRKVVEQRARRGRRSAGHARPEASGMPRHSRRGSAAGMQRSRRRLRSSASTRVRAWPGPEACRAIIAGRAWPSLQRLSIGSPSIGTARVALSCVRTSRSVRPPSAERIVHADSPAISRCRCRVCRAAIRGRARPAAERMGRRRSSISISTCGPGRRTTWRISMVLASARPTC